MVDIDDLPEELPRLGRMYYDEEEKQEYKGKGRRWKVLLSTEGRRVNSIHVVLRVTRSLVKMINRDI